MKAILSLSRYSNTPIPFFYEMSLGELSSWMQVISDCAGQEQKAYEKKLSRVKNRKR